MRNSLVATALAVAVSGVSAGAAYQEVGNWYQNMVEKIIYTGMGQSGQYQRVTNMENGACDKTAQPYSGSMSPMDEEISWHFRGPMDLYNFAAYIPSSSSKEKRETHSHERRRLHGHQHFHKRNKEIIERQHDVESEHDGEMKRAVGDKVTTTIDGKVVSWINTYDGGAPDGGAPNPLANPPSYGSPAESGSSPDTSATPVIQAISGADHSSSGPVPAGSWKRIARYSGSGGISEGLVTLNNMGGQGSGVFDNTYGNSLSYASSDATHGASSPQQFCGNLTSNQEVIFFTDRKCSSSDSGAFDSTCGYSRPGSVAYHGWGGANKAFVFEFDMPYDGNRGFNGDMPSLWALNAQIPRTGQYSGCSCWPTGCGEFDVCEVLNSGNSKCKSTFHGNNPGGSSDYFNRPVSNSMILAVLFYEDNIAVQQLSSFDFGPSLSEAQIESISSTSSDNSIPASMYSLGS